MFFPSLPTSSFSQMTSFNYQKIIKNISEESKKIKFNIYPTLPVIGLVALNIGATLLQSNLAKWTIRILAPTLGIIIIYKQLEKPEDQMDTLSQNEELDNEKINPQATVEIIASEAKKVEEIPAPQSPIAKDGSEQGPQQLQFSIENVRAKIDARKKSRLSPSAKQNKEEKPFSPSQVSNKLKSRVSNQNNAPINRQLNFEEKANPSSTFSPSKASEKIKNRKKTS